MKVQTPGSMGLLQDWKEKRRRLGADHYHPLRLTLPLVAQGRRHYI